MEPTCYQCGEVLLLQGHGTENEWLECPKCGEKHRLEEFYD